MRKALAPYVEAPETPEDQAPVGAASEELCGHEFSASTISELNTRLDDELEKFAHQRLEDEYPYLILDAR